MTGPTISARPVRVVTLAGVGAATLVELAGGQVGPPGWTTSFTTWGGLWSPVGVIPELQPWPGRLLAVGVVGFAAAFLGLLRLVPTADLTPGQVARVAAAWAVPLTLGPPLLSNDVYSYVAQGTLARAGVDPTRVSPWALGSASAVMRAVDPMWRGTVSPYGPLATGLERAVVDLAGGSPVLAVLGWRLLGVVGVAAIAVLALALARRVAGPAGLTPRREASVVAFTAANPLLLLHLLGAAHLEAVMVTLVLGGLLAATRPGRRWFVAGVVLVASAAAVKAPAAFALLVLACGVAPAPLRTVARRGAAVLGLTAATWLVWSLAARSASNPLAVLTTPSAGRTLTAPAVMLADLLSPLRWAGLAGDDALLTTARVVVAVAGAFGVLAVLSTRHRRPVVATVGLGLLVAALAGPVLYPWYLAWSVPLLAVTATGRAAGRLAVLSALGAVMCVQGLTRTSTVVLVLAVVAAAAVALVRIERGRGWTPTSALRLQRDRLPLVPGGEA